MIECKIHTDDVIVMVSAAPLILTLKLDLATFEYVNRLRQEHFPTERNLIPAHITLFHTLPGSHYRAIEQVLQTQCAQTIKRPLQLPRLRFLGNGVAIEVNSPDLIRLRHALAESWYQWLTPQDKQRYQPHITIQNKVATVEARNLYEQLGDRWQPMDGAGEGLLLWYYRGGPWELANEYCFSGSATIS